MNAHWGGALPRGSGLCPVPDIASPGPGNTLTRPSVPPSLLSCSPLLDNPSSRVKGDRAREKIKQGKRQEVPGWGDTTWL